MYNIIDSGGGTIYVGIGISFGLYILPWISKVHSSWCHGSEC
jgi:hypothetical protein